MSKKRGNGGGTVYERKSGTWAWQVSVGTNPLNGRAIRKSGTAPNKTEANKALARALTENQDGNIALPDTVTVGEWVNQWFERRKGDLAMSTVDVYGRNIKNHILPHLGKKKLQSVKEMDIQRFYDALRLKLDPETQQKIHNILNGALKDAHKKRIITRNPCEVIKPERKKSNSRVGKSWNPEEVTRFLEVARQDTRWGPVFEFLLATGTRRGEALGLRWANVDLERGTVRIVENLVTVNGKRVITTPKTASSVRTLHISPELVAVLKEHKTRQEHLAVLVGETWMGEGYVFSGDTGRSTQPENLKRALKPLCERANVPLIRIHDMRHTHISLMVAQGVPINVISKKAGHAQTSITLDRYSHALPEQDERYALSITDLVKRSSPSKILH